MRIYRLHPDQDNPYELIAAKLWQEIHPEHSQHGTLNHVLSNTQEPIWPSERDYQVAATLMQWLGTHVGRSFLEKLIERFDQHDKEWRRA